MTDRIASPDALRIAANQNKGIFDATLARAPSSVTFKGKTYPRAAADTVEKGLWYLAATAMTRPAAVAGLANVAYSLDEVYGLDPDRSRIDAAQAALTAANSAVSAVQGKLTGLRGMLRTYQANLARAVAAQKEAQKVQVGDVFTLGVSAAARNLYADGQVKIWQDRIESLQTGALVGMAGQEGFQVPLNDGIAQNEAKLEAARAGVVAATQELHDAQRDYDAEAKRTRDAEAKAKKDAATSAAEAARAEREAAALSDRAAQDAADAEAQRQAQMTTAQSAGSTDPSGYVSDDGAWAPDDSTDPSADDSVGDDLSFQDESEMLDRDELAADLAGDEEFVFNEAGDDGDAALAGYVSPFGFDTYYGCDECRAGNYGCDSECDGGCASAARERAEAMGFDEQSGYGFDPSIIVVILSAVLALAPAIIGMFSPPTSTDDGSPSNSGNDPLSALMGGLAGKKSAAEQQRIADEEAAAQNEKLAWGAGALILLKVLA